MRKRYFIATAILVVCLFAFASNPTKADYVSFVKDEITSEGHPFIGMFTSPLVNTFTSKQNYVLFSIYKTKFEDKGESMTAVGAFNNFYWINSPK
ncbi:DUF4359 domain-containing protein [Neobacillus sp. NRS-1170]|uniref:DUF4359 domain-containing protein n=1 Tax=Neobacillus sp. NRS-1170 TaxID=3233898 RepID=UPI003D280E6C